jgi:hypothetical protein
MPYYPNMTMDICSYTDTEQLDAYGNPRKAYVYRETVPVDFQPGSRNDSLTEAGELLQDTYRLFIDDNVTVNPTDIFRDSDGNTYTIIGTPILNNRFAVTRHKRVEVQKTNKPINVVVPDDDNG